MALYPKPAEGSWTEHYPDLGTGVVSSSRSSRSRRVSLVVEFNRSKEVHSLDENDILTCGRSAMEGRERG